MNVSELKNKIVVKLEECLPTELVNDIKNLRVALAEAATPAPVENQVKTKDGQILSIAGDPVLGVAVNVLNTDGTTSPAQDGEYTLEDGTVLTVTGGLISEVATASEEAPEQQMPQMSAEFQAQMDAQKNEINDLKTRLESVTKQNIDLSAALNKILTTPIEVKQAKHEEVDLDKLSPLERYRYFKKQ